MIWVPSMSRTKIVACVVADPDGGGVSSKVSGSGPASIRRMGVTLAFVCKRGVAFVASCLVPVKKAGSRSRNGFSQAFVFLNSCFPD